MSRKNKNKQITAGQSLAVISQPAPDLTGAASTILHDGKIWERVTIPGLVSAYLVRGTVPIGSPTFQYDGPQIPHHLWAQVLSYFKWANDTHHCEVQVRGFLNLAESAWKFWAFPQEKGGMTTKEIPGEDADRQRQAIGPGWDEFMSAHSHCSASAFQSGVDHNDEVDRPGLHITIGKLNDNQFDIDSRATFIHQGGKVHYRNIKLEEWFDFPQWMNEGPRELFRELTDDVILSIHKRAITSLPGNQMVDFPAEWRSNLIEKVWTPAASGKGANVQGSFYTGYGGIQPENNRLLLEILDICKKYGLEPEELSEIMPVAEDLKRAMLDTHHWDWDKARGVLDAAIIQGEIDDLNKLEGKDKSSNHEGNGVPDYAGCCSME